MDLARELIIQIKQKVSYLTIPERCQILIQIQEAIKQELDSHQHIILTHYIEEAKVSLRNQGYSVR